MELKQIPINKIFANFSQPREQFDKEKIKELAESILSNGLINPISIRNWKNGNYMLVAGERRWRACKIAGLKTIQAFVKEYKEDVDWQIESLVENLMRTDLNSTEREKYVYDLWKTGKFKSHSELSKRIGYKDSSMVSLLIRAKEDREKFGVRTHKITTLTMKKTEGLNDKDRKELLKKVDEGKIIPERVKEYAPIIKKAPEEVKKALLNDDITPEQAERISKLQKPEQREKAIQEHKNISVVEKGVERNVKNSDDAKEKREADKRLIQIKDMIASFRASITDNHTSLEKTLKILLINAKMFIPLMDDTQKEKFNEQLERFLGILERAEHITEQIKEKIK